MCARLVRVVSLTLSDELVSVFVSNMICELLCRIGKLWAMVTLALFFASRKSVYASENFDQLATIHGLSSLSIT